ncbi:DUF4031 domain-containing protein [Rhodomicrobium lacus]|uniref:DUF4031 domain-containing protein n=1 Tax=Rhodomicrobium lacus TaxID=2498452 RepID=UPI000F8C7F1C|nr:DUF4031 domain-containing protein [Rhodomicrobium lacus]
MTVYVDDMHTTPMGCFGRMKMSHMIADSEAELHEMAQAIGVARRWFQGDHYDICKSKREAAIARGARPISMRDFATKAMAGRREKRADALAATFSTLSFPEFIEREATS